MDTWVTLIKRRKKMKKFRLLWLGLLILVAMSTTGCRRPYMKPVFIDVLPNETAFLVPLEDQTKTDQAQVNSLEFLEEAKVASKRIELPQRFVQTNRMRWIGNWVPTMNVIKVDRSPVSREWTADKSSGSSDKDQAIWVESNDSIEFSMAISMTARVLEEDTALFLYQFSGRSLASIMDEDLRSEVMNRMNAKFGSISLIEGTANKVTLISEVSDEVKAVAKSWGIDITTCGSAGGMVYRDKEIQDQINAAFNAEKNIEITRQNNLARDESNAQDIKDAEAKVRAAEIWQEAIDIYEKQNELDIKMNESKAKLKWDGRYPSQMLVVPEDSPLLITPGR